MSNIGKQSHVIFSAALYVRLSREDGDKEESNSVANQKAMLSRFAGNNEDILIYDTYTDDGYTGTNFDRPAFQRMIRDIEDKNVNCVIVKDLSRFGRDYIDTGKYIEKYFVDKNIRFIAINDNVDSYKSPYDLMMPIKNLFNDQLAKDISQKVKTAIKVKQKEGQFIGAFASYGYKRSTIDKHKLVIDDYAAEVVRRIFSLYSRGTGKIRIAHILNEEGILCPSEYKKQCGESYRNCNKMVTTNYWTYSTIHNVLKNQMYLGDMVQGKTKRRMKGKAQYLPSDNWIKVEGTHQAIIDQELWDRVQKKLTQNARDIDFKNDVSIFAGFLKCGDCGRAMAKNLNLGYTHYVCGTYKSYGSGICSSHRINQAKLEKIILDDLNTILSSIHDLKALAESHKSFHLIDCQEVRRAIDRYASDIQKIETNKKASYQDYRDDVLTREEYLDYKAKCETKIDLLNKKIESLSEKLVDDGEMFESPWVQRLLDIKYIEMLDRSILEEMIEVIYVYNNRTIKIVYNFDEELELLLGNTHQESEVR